MLHMKPWLANSAGTEQLRKVHQRGLPAPAGIAWHCVQHESWWELPGYIVMESFFSRRRAERLSRKHYRTRDDLCVFRLIVTVDSDLSRPLSGKHTEFGKNQVLSKIRVEAEKAYVKNFSGIPAIL